MIVCGVGASTCGSNCKPSANPPRSPTSPSRQGHEPALRDKRDRSGGWGYAAFSSGSMRVTSGRSRVRQSRKLRYTMANSVTVACVT